MLEVLKGGGLGASDLRNTDQPIIDSLAQVDESVREASGSLQHRGSTFEARNVFSCEVVILATFTQCQHVSTMQTLYRFS